MRLAFLRRELGPVAAGGDDGLLERRVERAGHPLVTEPVQQLANDIGERGHRRTVAGEPVGSGPPRAFWRRSVTKSPQCAWIPSQTPRGGPCGPPLGATESCGHRGGRGCAGALLDVLVDLEHRQVHGDDDEADDATDDTIMIGSMIDVSDLTAASTWSS